MLVLKRGEYRKQTGVLKAFDAATNEGRVLVAGRGVGAQEVLLGLEFGQFSKKDGDHN